MDPMNAPPDGDLCAACNDLRAQFIDAASQALANAMDSGQPNEIHYTLATRIFDSLVASRLRVVTR